MIEKKEIFYIYKTIRYISIMQAGAEILFSKQNLVLSLQIRKMYIVMCWELAQKIRFMKSQKFPDYRELSVS